MFFFVSVIPKSKRVMLHLTHLIPSSTEPSSNSIIQSREHPQLNRLLLLLIFPNMNPYPDSLTCMNCLAASKL